MRQEGESRKLISTSRVEEPFFLRHLVFFFVPIAVGLMQWGSVFYDYGWVLAAAIVGSTALPLVIVGFMARGLRRSTDKKQALDKEDAPCRS